MDSSTLAASELLDQHPAEAAYNPSLRTEIEAEFRKFDLKKLLVPRWFVVRNVRQKPATVLLQPRWALSFLRGPMTLGDIKGALGR
jgi:hypothetical protein